MIPRTYDIAARVWPELREAIWLRADDDWRLYTWQRMEWRDLNEQMKSYMTFDLVCYGNRKEPERRVDWYILCNDDDRFQREYEGKTVQQALDEGKLKWRMRVQPEHIIGETTPEVAADWRLFAVLVLDAWQETADSDTETMVCFTPELRHALLRRRPVLAQLARAGADADRRDSSRAHHLGITYGWLKELADIAHALETP